MVKRVLNFGAGTQSTLLLMWAAHGEIEPVEVAIFADTGWEPRAVYEHLRWCEKEVAGKVRIEVVSAGNLRDDFLDYRNGGKRSASIPLFIKNADGSKGIIMRQCTKEYKIEPLELFVKRNLLGLKHGQVWDENVHDSVDQIFGISFDERQRMRRPHVRWAKYSYPLVDRKLNRWDVIRIAEQRWPNHQWPRSACIGCPFKSDYEWRRTKSEPDEWKDAVEFDKALRSGNAADCRGKLNGEPYLHSSLKPLDEVDLRSDTDKGQGVLFDPAGMVNECEGMCGV